MSERGNGFTLMSAGASLWEGEQLLFALPPMASPIINSAKIAPRPQPVSSPLHTKPAVIVPA
ncbi:hypothetical protein LJR234_003478 [Mesorhizobium amorphae]|uniref:hypothetical protein n=1 Tax=Mesorhizobium amorphae TaxID=71433 RepID=UPI003ECDA9D2